MESLENNTGGWVSNNFAGTEFSVGTVAVAILAVFLAAVGLDIFLGLGSVRAVLSVGIFLTFPGALVLTLFEYDPRPTLEWLLYAVGSSLLVIMLVGLVLNLTLPLAGVERPNSALSLGLAHTGVILGLSGAVRRFQPASTLVVPEAEAVASWTERWFRPTTFLFLLIPPLMILSINWLNLTSGNRPIIVMLVVIGFLPLLVALGKVGYRWLSLAIWTSGVSMMYHDTLWMFSDFTGKGHIVAAAQAGDFTLTQTRTATAVTSLLPNVTISPTFANLGGHNIFTQLYVFNPLLVVFIPLCSFVIFRRFVRPQLAALGAFLVIFIHPFYFQLPPGGRAAMPVLFVVLTTLALTDYEMRAVLRQGLALGFAAAIVTSHYGGAYFVMVAIGVAFIALLVLRVGDVILFDPGASNILSDVGMKSSGLRLVQQGRKYTLSIGFVLFYVSVTYGWYLYTTGGHRVARFVERIQEALTTYFQSSSVAGGGGGTANRVTRNYDIASVTFSRYLYLVLAALTFIAACGLLFRRYRGGEWRDTDGFDEYFVLSGGILGAFSLTFIFQSIWGGGRPMAIAFSLAALFAVLGVYAIVAVVAKLVELLPGINSISQGAIARTAGVLFACLLSTLLLLNSGVAAATVLGGGAPSEVPLHSNIEDRAETNPADHATVHLEQDVSMLVWLNEYANNTDGPAHAFSDRVTRQRAVDRYEPQITAGVEAGESRGIEWTPDLFELRSYEGKAYVVLASYNANLDLAQDPAGGYYAGARRYSEMPEVTERLLGELKIYDNGDSEIYQTVPLSD